MSDDVVFSTQAARNLLNRAEFHLVPYLRPIHEAMKAKAIAAHLCFHDTVAAQLADDLPAVLIYFDALDGGAGPSGFQKGLLDDVAAAAAAVIVVSRFDAAEPYSLAVETAVRTGGLVLLVETTEAHAGEWLTLAKPESEGGVWLLWSSPVAGRA